MGQKLFYQKVGRSKEAMINFLKNHFRYDTMSSWNRSTSYANNVKIHKCIPSEYQDKVFEMLDSEDFYDDINMILNDFGINHDHKWQTGFNGRSSGYIVLYEGYVETKTIFNFKNCDRDYADGYGWKSLEEAKSQGLYKKEIKRIHTWPGRSIDMGEDFLDWSYSALKERVKLVQEFDQMCDDVVNTIIETAKTCKVEEEEYIITKTRKVITCNQ